MLRDGQWGPDGSRSQGWLRHVDFDRSTSRPGFPTGALLGVVLEVKHKDDENNPTDSYPVYTVMLADREFLGLVLRNVATIGQKMGTNSGLEMTLTPASDTPNIDDPTQAMQNILDSDGDLVIIQYVSRIPVIWGCMNHIRSGDSAAWYGDSTDGERMALHHKGTAIMIEDDSTVAINLEDTKDVTITIDGTEVFKVTRNGGTSLVELAGGGESLVLGDAFKTWFDANVAGHTHTIPAVADTNGDTLIPGSSTGGSVPALANSNLSSVSETG